MAHIFFVDPLEKLTIKKDSSLILALALQEAGAEVWLLFEKDFYYSNEKQEPLFALSPFVGEWDKDGFYLDQFTLQKKVNRPFRATDTLHMRIEPPFDKRYLNHLWMLRGIQQRTGIKIVNSPEGLLLYNEKISAYLRESSVDSFVGDAPDQFSDFAQRLRKNGFEEIVLKPLDLFQGEGVEKISLAAPYLVEKFCRKTLQAGGPIVAQPFLEDIYKGEIRSIFFNGREIGNLLKIPRRGDFLSTVARGASCHPTTLNPGQRRICEQTALELQQFGIRWIAFDLLGDSLQEINITCPGLLPEISRAAEKRLVEKMLPDLLH